MSVCSCFRGHALLCSVHDEEAIRLMGQLSDMLQPPAEPAAPAHDTESNDVKES